MFASPARLSAPPAANPTGSGIIEATGRFFRIYGTDNLEGPVQEPVCSLIDVLTAFTLPGEGNYVRETVAVTTAGHWYGETTRDPGGVLVDVFRSPGAASVAELVLDLAGRCTPL